MKRYLLAAALIVSAPVLAQEMTPPPAGTDAGMANPVPAPADAAPATPGMAPGTTTSDTGATPDQGMTPDQSTTAPAADPMAQQPAPSGDAAADPAAGGTMGPGQAAPGQMSPGQTGSAAMTPQPSTKDYPRCSRTVTDNCTNRGGR